MAGGHFSDMALLWVHLLGMAGAFGGLWVAHRALAHADGERLARLMKVPSLLLAAGFLAGLALYATLAHRLGAGAPSRFHALIAVKFLLLLLVGACMGIAGRKLRTGQDVAAGRLRVIALVALAVAALLGLSLRLY